MLQQFQRSRLLFQNKMWSVASFSAAKPKLSVENNEDLLSLLSQMSKKRPEVEVKAPEVKVPEVQNDGE